MTRKEWQEIDKARQCLGLGEKATREEIKRAYRRLSKKHHPDRAGKGDSAKMYRLTAAYELLCRYCDQYRFPLVPGDDHIYDAEDWWMERFGRDPLWSRRR